MKIIITERQKDLLFEGTMNDSLYDMFREDGYREVYDLLGGFQNIKKVTGIKEPMEFLQIFDGLTPVKTNRDGWIVYKTEGGKTIFKYDDTFKTVYISKNMIYGFLNDYFWMRPQEIERLISKWLKDSYDLKVDDVVRS